MIRAAFFDFDGTLVGSDYSGLSLSTRAALSSLRARGVSLWLATGRAIHEIPSYVAKGIEGVGTLDGYVCNSGSWCMDANGVFFSRTLDRKDIVSIVDAVKKGAFDVCVLTPERHFVNRRSLPVKRLEAEVKLTYPVDDIDNALREHVLQMCAFVPPTRDVEILELTRHATCYRWSPLFCDVVPMDSGKGVGVTATLQHLNLTSDEAIAFGDGGNDVPMLKACATSVAMGNGTPEAKAAATYVTDTVDADGLYKACVALGLITNDLGLS